MAASISVTTLWARLRTVMEGSLPLLPPLKAWISWDFVGISWDDMVVVMLFDVAQG